MIILMDTEPRRARLGGLMLRRMNNSHDTAQSVWPLKLVRLIAMQSIAWLTNIKEN